MKKRKKKHWTSKNTHLKQMKSRDENSFQPMSRFERKCFIFSVTLAIISGILLILLKALNNQTVGYDYFPSIPSEWIEWLK